MTEVPLQEPRRSWHQALVYAITGQRHDAGATQTSPDLEQLARELRSQPGSETLSQHAQDRLGRGELWPHPVPADLMSGLGYAQFLAALTQLIRSLDLSPSQPTAARGAGNEPTTAVPPGADLRRLLDEVPPHHGS